MFVVHSLLMALSLSGTASDPASNELDGATAFTSRGTPNHLKVSTPAKGCCS